MAKRKRLTPADPLSLRSVPATPDPGRMSPPIAGVAGDAATTAALQELSAEMEAARREGRMIQTVALDDIRTDYLVRDRIHVDDAEMAALMASLKARGQQSPIELVALSEGDGARYGLISGWRRITALQQLQDETGDAGFGTVLAVVRAPDSAADAYVAMVEENEIRVGLSYFERARIVDQAVEGGVCRDETAALQILFSSASRAKRSKIKSFLPVVRALGGHLNFPTAIPERLGLALAQALADPGFAARLKDRLRKGRPETAEAEQALLTRALQSGKGARSKGAPEEVAQGIFWKDSSKSITLSGPGLTPEIREKLRGLLKE